MFISLFCFSRSRERSRQHTSTSRPAARERALDGRRSAAQMPLGRCTDGGSIPLHRYCRRLRFEKPFSVTFAHASWKTSIHFDSSWANRTTAGVKGPSDVSGTMCAASIPPTREQHCSFSASSLFFPCFREPPQNSPPCAETTFSIFFL